MIWLIEISFTQKESKSHFLIWRLKYQWKVLFCQKYPISNQCTITVPYAQKLRTVCKYFFLCQQCNKYHETNSKERYLFLSPKNVTRFSIGTHFHPILIQVRLQKRNLIFRLSSLQTKASQATGNDSWYAELKKVVRVLFREEIHGRPLFRFLRAFPKFWRFPPFLEEGQNFLSLFLFLYSPSLWMMDLLVVGYQFSGPQSIQETMPNFKSHIRLFIFCSKLWQI